MYSRPASSRIRLPRAEVKTVSKRRQYPRAADSRRRKTERSLVLVLALTVGPVMSIPC